MKRKLLENTAVHQPLTEIEHPLPFDYTILEGKVSGRIRVGGEFQLADVKNANGRVYPEALWDRQLSNQRQKDRLVKRRMVGELDHPGDGRGKLERAALVITKLEKRASKRYPGKQGVYGEYETLSTPHGKILESLIRDNIGLGVSSRGDGDVIEQDGANVVIPESYELDTFDVVLDPSVDVDVKALGESALIARAVSRLVESNQVERNELPGYKAILEAMDTSRLPESSKQIINDVHTLVEDRMKINAAQRATITTLSAEAQQLFSTLEADNGRLEAELAIALRDASNTEQKAKQALTALETERKKVTVATEAISELTLRNKQQELMMAGFREDAEYAPETEQRLEAAKQVISRLTNEIQPLKVEREARIAAEALLDEMASQLRSTQKEVYIDTLIANESAETQEKLRPLLLEVKGGAKSISARAIALKSLMGEERVPGRRRSNLNEDTIPVARLRPRNMLEELQDDPVTGSHPTTDKELENNPLRESVLVSRAIKKLSTIVH